MGVGENLHDHPNFVLHLKYVYYVIFKNVSLFVDNLIRNIFSNISTKKGTPLSFHPKFLL